MSTASALRDQAAAACRWRVEEYPGLRFSHSAHFSAISRGPTLPTPAWVMSASSVAASRLSPPASAQSTNAERHLVRSWSRSAFAYSAASSWLPSRYVPLVTAVNSGARSEALSRCSSVASPFDSSAWSPRRRAAEEMLSPRESTAAMNASGFSRRRLDMDASAASVASDCRCSRSAVTCASTVFAGAGVGGVGAFLGAALRRRPAALEPFLPSSSRPCARRLASRPRW